MPRVKQAPLDRVFERASDGKDTSNLGVICILVKYNAVGSVECGPMENTIRSRGEVCGLAFGSAGEASADVHRLARVCADEIAGKRFRKGLIDADSVEDAAAMIQAQIYREWGVAIVKGRAECLLALLECTVPNASPRSKVACGKSRDKLIEW